MRERERGTLEQLMVTPVSPLGVVVGKLLPYLVLAFVQLLIILVVMTHRLPRADPRLAPAAPGRSRCVYLLALLSLGLLVSSRAKTQVEAIQLAMTRHAAVGPALRLHLPALLACRCRCA